MAQNKRNKTQILQDRQTIAAMMRRGQSQMMIAEKLGVCQQQVSYDYKVIQRQLVAHMTKDAEALRAVKLAEILEMKNELWEQWERSKEDLQRLTEKRYKKPDKTDDAGEEIEGAESLEITRMTEGRLAMAAYMGQIRDLIDMECKLQGIYPDKVTHIKGQINSTTVQMDWDAFAKEVETEQSDQIEAKIQAVLGYTPENVVIDQSAQPPINGERNGHA